MAKEQIARGEKPTGEMVIPGVLSWDDYKKRQHNDDVWKCVSLDAQFYKGRFALLFPENVLLESIDKAAELSGIKRRAVSMGVDAAEGGDSSCWTIADDLGLIFQHSQKTSDTADIPGITIAYIKEHNINPQDVLFDRGGGGKQHSDQLHRRGYPVRSIGFGESAVDNRRDYLNITAKVSTARRLENSTAKYAYKNRRAQMYGMFAITVENGFAIPQEMGELIRQLGAIPKLYDGEGRLLLPPKNKTSPNYTGSTLTQLLGHSPDEADSAVLANYIRQRPVRSVVAGALR